MSIDNAMDRLRAANPAPDTRLLRAELDDRNEKLGFKIREAEINKIPLSLVIGEKEAAAGTVTPRLRKSKKTQFEPMAADDLVSQLVESTSARRMGPLS